MRSSMGEAQEGGERTDLGPAERLLDDHVAALGSEGDRDGLCEDVDAREESLAALVAEAELLLR